MQHPSRSPRANSPLAGPLHNKLNTYAVSSAAAGVALLAITPPADAEVVFTPVNGTIAQGSKYALDLNHDGIIDFTIINDIHLSTTPFGDDLDISPAVRGNGVFQGPRERFNGADAAALPARTPIGTGKPFIFQEVNMAYASLTAFTYVSGARGKTSAIVFLD